MPNQEGAIGITNKNIMKKIKYFMMAFALLAISSCTTTEQCPKSETDGLHVLENRGGTVFSFSNDKLPGEWRSTKCENCEKPIYVSKDYEYKDAYGLVMYFNEPEEGKKEDIELYVEIYDENGNRSYKSITKEELVKKEKQNIDKPHYSYADLTKCKKDSNQQHKWKNEMSGGMSGKGIPGDWKIDECANCALQKYQSCDYKCKNEEGEVIMFREHLHCDLTGLYLEVTDKSDSNKHTYKPIKREDIIEK